jgi:Alr-MurF fusion protein
MIQTFENISRQLTGETVIKLPQQDIKYLGLDSRIISHPAQTLFFAIKSKSGDGHKYLQECFAKGVRCFVLEDKNAINSLPEEIRNQLNYIVVENTVAALQKLATKQREKFDIPVIGITGSNGKTVVKEWLYQLLNEDHRIVRSPQSYNSQIGVPLSVWPMNENHQLAIFEAGISQAGEMEKLEKIIKPGIGIFTNIGSAHQANFYSVNEKAGEKLKLFKNCNILIYCTDYKEIENALNEAIKTGELNKEIKLINWSFHNKSADIYINKLSENSLKGTDFQYFYQNQHFQLHIPFTDKASIENAIHCLAFMLSSGYKNELIQTRMQKLHAVEMRLEQKAGINNCTLINDSYNSDILSLSVALDALNQQQQHSKKTLILSDIFESGRSDEELYKEVAQLTKQKGVSKIIGIGSNISAQAATFPQKEKYFYTSTTDFLQNIESGQFSNESVLIKGSRKFGFEAIARRLQQKAHNTVLEINLNALIHNLNTYRSFLYNDTKIMAMVKAFSYGSGSYEIANVLQYHKVDYLAVAYADEGNLLRQNGISLPIMVMNPEESAFEGMLENRLEPEIYSFRTLKQFADTISASNHAQEPYNIHIKLDTGMHRLGFMAEEADELIATLKNYLQLQVKSIFSHLASADIPEHDEFTREQIRIFDEISYKISREFSYPILRHILNSSGIARFPEAQFDMVRLGIGLYGIDPGSVIQDQLEPVNTLKTYISQIKKVKAGQTVGYSRKGQAMEDKRTATIGIGYADGFPRSLGNGIGFVQVNGKEAPIIGNVCMDMCMIDITEIDAEEGDEVIIFGKEHPLETLAASLDTIPYEVLTNISQRVKRVYIRE